MHDLKDNLPGEWYGYAVFKLFLFVLGKLDMIVAGAGTGGTLSGLAKKIKEKIPNVQVRITRLYSVLN